MSSNLTINKVSDTKTWIINPTLYEFFITFNLVICSNLIGCFGIVGNVINILNFKTQGLRDSVNVTLTTLAVSDIGFLLLKLLMNVMMNPFFDYMEAPFSSSAITTIFFYPHSYFSRVSGYITAFASFERCLCVVLPLKVKFVITMKVSVIVNCSIFFVLSLYMFPVYYVTYLDIKHIPNTNRSVLTAFTRENSESVLKMMLFINDLLIPYISFLILILSTSVIITSLKSKARWRHSVTVVNISQSSSKSEVVSSKEKKTVVMLTTVSVIYVACLTPSCVMLTVVAIVRELKVGGEYFELTRFVMSFTSILETINCSVTMIVYYKMSSNYRNIIQTWFPYFKHNK